MHATPDFTSFERALSSLQAAQAQPPRNALERDGVMQRFEYTFEYPTRPLAPGARRR